MSTKMATKAIAALLLAIAAYLIYLPFELGAGLTIPPDASEYSISLANLLEHGRFGFTLNGVWYPSRYAPWFSLFCLTPAHYVFGGNPLCYHWMILVFALATLVFVFKWAERLGLTWKQSLVAPILLMLLPDFVFYSRLTMTEIPYVCLFAASGLAFLRICKSEKPSLAAWLGVGALVTWCGMVRSSALSMFVPFGVALLLKKTSLGRKFVALVLLGLPAACYQVAALLYNRRVFGSIFRSGYNFWMPVPYDFPQLLFNWKYVWHSLRHLPQEPVIVLTAVLLAFAVAFVILLRRGKYGGFTANRNFLLLGGYLLFHLVVLLALYLGYYWFDTRFYLAVTICAVPLALGALVRMLGVGTARGGRFLFTLVLLVGGVFFLQCPTRYGFMTNGRPLWLEEARITARALPEGSVVIQEGDPNILDYFGFAAKKFTLLPLARTRFDYVTYMTAPKAITDAIPAPKSYREKRIDDCIARGICGDPFPETFAENPACVKKYVQARRRVFFHKGCSSHPNWVASVDTMLREHDLALRPYSTWESPAIVASPLRHWFDRLLFPSFTMDARRELNPAYYEVVPAHEVPRADE